MSDKTVQPIECHPVTRATAEAIADALILKWGWGLLRCDAYRDELAAAIIVAAATGAGRHG